MEKLEQILYSIDFSVLSRRQDSSLHAIFEERREKQQGVSDKNEPKMLSEEMLESVTAAGYPHASGLETPDPVLKVARPDKTGKIEG